METERIYDLDSHAAQCAARVTACRAEGDGFWAALDRTCFFPEGGGQYGDRGTLRTDGGAEYPVTDTQEKAGQVWHAIPRPLAVGTEVTALLDWKLRFARMQCHSGEHILSGLFHRIHGLDNVGFHLGDEEMTLDLSGPVTWEEIQEIERMANRAVGEDVPITAEYPDGETLARLDYRSKLDLTNHVRIVTIPGYDVCACCAPHVKRTGEIGLIHILSSQNWKKGVRLRVLCGSRAVEDLLEKQVLLTRIGAQLSVRQPDTARAVERLSEALVQARYESACLGKRLAQAIAQTLPAEKHALVIEELDTDALRALVNAAVERGVPLCAAFAPNGDRYSYIVGSSQTDLRPWVKELNRALHGRGGGQAEMVQGSVAADQADITRWWKSLGY